MGAQKPSSGTSFVGASVESPRGEVIAVLGIEPSAIWGLQSLRSADSGR